MEVVAVVVVVVVVVVAVVVDVDAGLCVTSILAARTNEGLAPTEDGSSNGLRLG